MAPVAYLMRSMTTATVMMANQEIPAGTFALVLTVKGVGIVAVDAVNSVSGDMIAYLVAAYMIAANATADIVVVAVAAGDAEVEVAAAAASASAADPTSVKSVKAIHVFDAIMCCQILQSHRKGFEYRLLVALARMEKAETFVAAAMM